MSKLGSRIILWAFIAYFTFCQVLFNRYGKMNDKLNAAVGTLLAACTVSKFSKEESDKYQ